MIILKKALAVIAAFIVFVLTLFYFDIMWKSPSFYKVNQKSELTLPVMDMKQYKEIISSHRRPYIFTLTAKNGAKVSIVGVDHRNDPSHSQFDSIRYQWRDLNPDAVLVEGRLGFLFTWLQNPIEEYGESGLASFLAKKEGKELYTWEPTRDDEVESLKEYFSLKQLAMFYALRPYFSLSHKGVVENPEERIQEFIDSRTDYNHIRGAIKSYKDIDEEWSKHYQNIDWRTYSNPSGYMPKGLMHNLWNASNIARDEHLIQAVLELLRNNKNVFVTVGVSHAPRIEGTLKEALK
ncbi:MAG: hypothetical protein JXQ93_05720 [Flavobacteriaceae bacterium]